MKRVSPKLTYSCGVVEASSHDQHEGDNSEEIKLGDISEKDVEKEETVKEKNVVKNKVFVFGKVSMTGGKDL